MLLSDVWEVVQQEIFPTPSTSTLFNPYRDRNEAYDLPQAPAIRRDNLRRYLACYEARPPIFLLAEAPGPWGCRFSGVPLVCEAQLVDPAFPIDGRPSSLRTDPHTEYSAGIYWRVLQPYFPHFFTWNTVPYHPHREEDPMSIRTPRSREIKDSTHVVAAILEVLRPECVLAVGRKAQHALEGLGVRCTYIRHPSQGGAKKFEAGVKAVVRRLGLVPAE